MQPLVTTLLPLIVVSILAPTQVTIVILLLQSPQRGLTNGIAYAGGGVLVRLLQGVLFGLVLAAGDLPLQHQDWHSVVAYTLQFVLGIALLIGTFAKWRQKKEPVDATPKWLERVDHISIFGAFGIGFIELLVALNLWVFTLAAIAVIVAADLGSEATVLAYLLFILLISLPVIIPIAIRVFLPKRSTKTLQTLSQWIAHHDHSIIIILLFFIGLFLLAHGIQGLVTYQ